MSADVRGLEFRVGLLIVTALVVLVGFVVVLGNFSFRSGYDVYVDYDFVGNLQEGAPVKVSGIKVGHVDEVGFWAGQVDPKVGRRVRVRLKLWVEDRAKESLRQDSEFFINTAGVLGEQYVEIVPPPTFDQPVLAEGAIARGSDPPRTDLVVSRLYEVLDGLALVLRNDRDKISQLLVNSADAVETAGQLLRDNREAIGALLRDGGAVAREASLVLADVQQGLNPNDVTALVREAQGTLRTARGTLEAVTPPAVAVLTDARRVTGLITEPRLETALTAVDQASAALREGETLLRTTNAVVADVRAGKGTVGGLITREDVYADLRELIRDLKRNPWKLFWKE